MSCIKTSGSISQLAGLIDAEWTQKEAKSNENKKMLQKNPPGNMIKAPTGP